MLLCSTTVKLQFLTIFFCEKALAQERLRGLLQKILAGKVFCITQGRVSQWINSNKILVSLVSNKTNISVVNDIEKAVAQERLRKLLEDSSQEEVSDPKLSEITGKPYSSVLKHRHILELPDFVQKAIRKEELSSCHN